MTSSNGSATDKSSTCTFGFKGKRDCGKGNWSPMNTGAMVLGFIAFWPLGLVLLYWNISGRDVRDLPAATKEKWAMLRAKKNHHHSAETTDNSLFNEFQQTQYDRIREIKEEIKDRSNRFKDFRADAKRRADEEEFNSFMSNSPERSGN